MEEFFEKGTLPEEHIVAGLDEEMRKDLVFPVLCMSGLHDVGSDRLLDLIVEAFPSPLDRPPAKAHAQWERNRTSLRRFRPRSGSRFQNHRRSFRRPHFLLQSALRGCPK